MSPRSKKIIQYIKEISKEDNLVIQLDNHLMALHDGVPYSSGYFDYPTEDSELKSPLIAVGINKPEDEWIEVLLHEFNHYLQWKNQTRKWKNNVFQYQNYEEGMIETEEMIQSVLDMELECEKNTITLAKKIGYELDEINYIKKINAYLLFYQIFHKHQRWYKEAPFYNDEIMEYMPSTLINNHLSFKIKPEIESIYISLLKD